MSRIERLDPGVVNKIAAGEVIERPASVVKELVENALDAGATRVDVSLAGGGSELVRVTDNGNGISDDQLLLAVAPHATSKLRDADDLFRVSTLGFRGEALASIAEVSRLCLRSRPPAEAAAAELEVAGGVVGGVTPASAAPGTTVEVHRLFFNTPVRRKFLRSIQTEVGHCSEAFIRLALAHPQVHFTLRHQERLIHDLPPSDPWLLRIAQLFGRELADDLIWVESSDEPIRLFGYVANPVQSRSHQRMQYLFLNGRHIRDRSLQHALGEAYRGLLMTGRCPISFLQIEMPADQVDVNVHPTKLEVRFQDAGRLYSQLLSTIRTRFLATDLTARLSPYPAASAISEAQSDASAPTALSNSTSATQAFPSSATGYERSDLDEPWRQRTWSDRAPDGASDRGGDPGPLRFHHVEPSGSAIAPDSRFNFANRRTDHGDGVSADPTAPGAPVAMPHAGNAVPRRTGPAALQVHNCYLIVETDEGMLVIDQHALHERILYERFRERVLAGACESQILLVPEPLDLTSREAAAVLEQRPLLAQLGVTVEPFGGDTVLITSYPAMLAKLSPAEVVRSLADQLVTGAKLPERRDLLDSMLNMMACKAAIKSGDRLTPGEIETLLAERHLVNDTHHCPHGRPTALVFTREELDKQFKRI